MRWIKGIIKVYKHVFNSLLDSLLLATPIAILIILIFAYLYQKGPLNSLSFYNCLIFSAETFFSFPHTMEYTLKGTYKLCACLETLSYPMFFLILIGCLLDKINEDDKNKRWKPIENLAYSELKRESINLKSNATHLLLGLIIINN